MTLFLTLSLWRDISLVWLSLLCFIGLVFPLALAYLAVRGMDVALNKAAFGFQKVQQYSRLARAQTEKLSERVRDPVIHANRGVVKWQQVGRTLFPKAPASPSVSTKQSGQGPD